MGVVNSNLLRIRVLMVTELYAIISGTKDLGFSGVILFVTSDSDITTKRQQRCDALSSVSAAVDCSRRDNVELFGNA